LLADELDEYAARHLHVEIDGCDVSGAYVLAAVMNAQSLGPALGIAPQAKVDDGELDVVLVPPAAKEALVVNLRRAARAGDLALPALDTARARHVRLRADGRWIHIDDAPRELNGCATIDVASGAVRLLAPSHRRR
jgi:diacylglycerol kinase (ATP)